jgi:hypothetical protein
VIKIYEVFWETQTGQVGIKAANDAINEYLRRECQVTPPDDEGWRDNLELDDDYIGNGANAHEDADGPVFRSKVAALNLQAYLRDALVDADVIEHQAVRQQPR